MRKYRSLGEAITETHRMMRHESRVYASERWQGIDVSKKPEMEMHVILNHSFEVGLSNAVIDYYRDEVKPNLPWADDHFDERIGGQPLNPGQTWKTWPWAHSADKFRDVHGRFSHTYMERMWPRLAGKTDQGELTDTKFDLAYNLGNPELDSDGAYTITRFAIDSNEHRGIYHRYGDYRDLIELLAREPTTRQAYLPIWFPEDTGDVHQERKPCTLGYLFDIYDGKLNVTYYIRSCDLRRHFRDDIYLTIRLMLHLRQELIERWVTRIGIEDTMQLRVGTFTMHIRNLHVFRNDFGEKW